MISNDLSAFYMDVSKDRLYCDDKNDLKRKQCQDVLVYTLKALLAVVAPIAPFTCEDIYQYYIIDNNKKIFKIPTVLAKFFKIFTFDRRMINHNIRH